MRGAPLTKATLSGTLVIDDLYGSKRQTSATNHGGRAKQFCVQGNLGAQSSASSIDSGRINTGTACYRKSKIVLIPGSLSGIFFVHSQGARHNG